MTARVCFPSAAEEDLTAAFVWYEGQSTGLGERMLEQVQSLLHRLTESPRQFPVVKGRYRRGLLHGFPYGVYFSEELDEIRIHAVLHLHRDPAHWRRRLEGEG